MAQSSWLYLLLAGLFELGFTTIMKLSDGFSMERPGYVVAFCLCALASFGMINLAIKGIPLGTAYAIWTGIGVFGTVIIGIVWFGDPTTPSRLVFLSLLLVSIIGLKLVE
jgi:quaternary ammonium compound-resistance protein SugE